MIYLDHNATSPPLLSVRRAVAEAMDSLWANPSSGHGPGRAASVAVERARRQVAGLLGRPPKDITFTSGATESNAWALQPSADRPRVVVGATEHPSVLAWATDVVGADEHGRLDLDALESILDETVGIISVMAANNETGVLGPISEVRELAKRCGAAFHCDATQLPGRLPVDIEADMVTLSGHKFGAPRGVGVLASAHPPPPFLKGGGQERGRRSGTLNVPGIVGLGIAAEEMTGRTMDPTVRDRLVETVKELGGRVVGEGAPRLANTVCALFNDVAGDLIAAALDLRGFCVSTGSACSSGAHQDSHVLVAMGTRGAPIRISFGPDGEDHGVGELLADVLSELRA